MNRDGYVYIMAMGVVVFLTLAGAAMLIRGVSETGLSERDRSQVAAIHLADAAVDQAAFNLRTPTDPNDDIMVRNVPAGELRIESQAETFPGSGRWVATTRGTSTTDAGNPRRVESVLKLTAQSIFQGPLFGDQGINVSGNANTDSYDSRNGAYGGANKGHKGNIGTNSTASGGITLGSGSYFIDGQVMVGPNVSDPAAMVTGENASLITGGTSPPSDAQDLVSMSAPFPMPPVSVPLGLTCDDYVVQGNTTVTLAPGTYCYRNLVIQGNATLTASGEVTIYVTGELNAQGNSTVGVPSDPSQTLFKMTATAAATLEQTIQGNNTFYGAIYGPQAAFNIQGNATIYGSVVARQIDIQGNAIIHYDEALGDCNGPTPPQSCGVSNLYKATPVSWREL